MVGVCSTSSLCDSALVVVGKPISVLTVVDGRLLCFAFDVCYSYQLLESGEIGCQTDKTEQSSQSSHVWKAD